MENSEHKGYVSTERGNSLVEVLPDVVWQVLAQAADENREQLLKLSCSRTFVDLFHCVGEVNEKDVEVVLESDIVLVEGSAEGVKKLQCGNKPFE